MLRHLVLLAVVLAVLPSLAAADGMFVKKRAALRQALAEPNQKALIFRERGREALILQVKYAGRVEEFGWIVPVPGRPQLGAASIAVFYELADLTVPPSQLQGGKGGMGGARGAGVTVVEQAEVGPYDATVLAASEPSALAEWLRKHDYVLPADAETVLKSYTDRGWYYVALRVRAKQDLLSRLQRIDPGLRSLQQAPERLTRLVMSLVDTQPSPGARKVEAIQKAIASATGEPEDPEVVGGRPGFGAPESVSIMSYAYHEYHQIRLELDAGRPRWEGMWPCVSKCADGPRGRAFRAAAKSAGLQYHGDDPAIGQALAAAVYHDLWNGVPYGRSRFGRLHAALGGRAAAEKTTYFASTYEMARTLLAQARRRPTEAVDLAPLDNASRGDQHLPAPVQGVGRLLSERNQLVQVLKREIATGTGAAQQALAGGTLAPLRLDFATNELVYPLYISSLNQGTTKLQLYVLSDHRVAATDFRTDYAAPLQEQLLPWHQELWKLVGPGRTYLTKLGATLSSADMTRDVTITRAATDEPRAAVARPDAGVRAPRSGRGGRRPVYHDRRGPSR